MSTSPPSDPPFVEGSTAPGYERLIRVFQSNFTERGDTGASFCAYVDGKPVVDIWGGEGRPGRAWESDTLAVVFSTTKGATALTIQALADHGVLDVDVPIASFWPEFAAAAEASVTTRQVLTHTSGLIDFPGYARVLDDPGWWHDPDRIAADFAGAAPAWTPGTAHGYHGVSFGLILGEVVRRATGATIGSAFRTLVAEPLELDVWIGLPAEHHDRVAVLHDPPPPSDPITAAYLSIFTQDTLTARAHFCDHRGISAMAGHFNDPSMWTAEFPSGGGIASAAGLARMYAALAEGGALDGRRVVSEASIRRHTAEQVRGEDLVLLFETRYGLGYQRPTPFLAIGGSDATFGHGGLGGSLAMADPRHRIAAAYVMNQLQFPTSTERTRAQVLLDAVYEAAGR